MKEFKTELDKFLIDNIYLSIDIFPLIKSYNDGKNQIKSSISLLISSYKADGLINIEDESYNALYWISPTAIETSDREIFVTATNKFEQLYKEQNKPIVQPIHFETHGDNSPIAGHNLTIGDISQSSSKNLDLNEEKDFSNNIPSQNDNAKNQKSLSKIASWIFENIVIVVIVTVISAFIIWKLKWN